MTVLQQEFIDNLQSIMDGIAPTTSFDSTFYESVVLRLESLGYTVLIEDDWMLAFCIQKVENKIKNLCNISSVPDTAIQIAVDMVCGEFLYNLQQTGKLTNQFNTEAAIKKVSLGDTSVDFGSNGNTQSLDTLIKYLICKEGDLLCFRKMSW